MGVKGRSGRKPKYPWNLWFKRGQIIELTQGVDFDGYVRSFIGTIYRAANQHGIKVHVNQLSDTKLLVTCR